MEWLYEGRRLHECPSCYQSRLNAGTSA